MPESSDNPPPTSEEAQDSAELMYVRCSVCGKWMDVKPGRLHYTSHSFCPECYEAEMRKLNREPS